MRRLSRANLSSAAGLLRALFILILFATIAPNWRTPADAVIAGDAAAHAGDLDAALGAYGRALALQPWNVIPLARIVSLEMAGAPIPWAVQDLERLIAFDGASRTRSRALGDLLAAQGDLFRALPHWEDARRGGLADSVLLLNLARGYMAAARWDDALAVLQEAPSGDPEIAYRLGALLAPTHPEDALPPLFAASEDPIFGAEARALMNAVSIYQDADPAQLAAGVGVAHLSHGSADLAARALKIALQTDPANATYLVYLGIAQDDGGRDGAHALAEAAFLAPDDPLVHYGWGLHHRAHGDHESALAAFQRAAALAPDDPTFAAEMARTLQLMGALEEAEAWYQQAAALSDDAHFQKLLARFYAEEGYKLADAIPVIEDALKNAPGDADLLASLGYVQLKSGDIDSALVTLAGAAESGEPRTLYAYAEALESAGDPDAAREIYRRLAAMGESGGVYTKFARRALDQAP
jgi:tetratricopeptide (TPR) repeat protein